MTNTNDTSNTPAVAADAQTAPRAQGRRKAPKFGKRPQALTEYRLEMICEKIANGVPQTTAAVAAGVPRRTFQEWLEKGRRPEAAEPYRSMAERIEAAIAVYHESRVDLVQEGAVKDPRLAQWELERRFKDDWGDPRRGDVNVSVNVMGSPEWHALLERIADVLRERHPEALRTLAAEFGYVPVSAPVAIDAAT